MKKFKFKNIILAIGLIVLVAILTGIVLAASYEDASSLLCDANKIGDPYIKDYGEVAHQCQDYKLPDGRIVRAWYQAKQEREIEKTDEDGNVTTAIVKDDVGVTYEANADGTRNVINKSGKVTSSTKKKTECTLYVENASELVEQYSDEGKTAAKLDENYSIHYAARDIALYNNMYCVSKGKRLDNKLVMEFNKNIHYQATSVAKIIGDTAYFYKIIESEDGKSKKLEFMGSNEAQINNVIAGILTEEDPNGLMEGVPNPNNIKIYQGYGRIRRIVDTANSGAVYTGHLIKNTRTQIALWTRWNKWCSENAPYTTDAGFLESKDNEEFDDDMEGVLSYLDKYINKLSDDETKQYRATIYFMEVQNSDYDTQNLIILEKDTDIPVKKVWDDEDGNTTNRPASITVKLLANGVDTGKTLELNAANNWQGEFTELEKNDDAGNEIVYTIEEVSVPGYTTSEIEGDQNTGYTITNTLDKTQVEVEKVWDDNNNVDGVRPTSITVTLTENGKATTKTATLKVDNWSYTFENLPIYKNGNLVTYDIKETVPSGYISNKVITGDAETGFKIILTNTLELIDIPVEKVWNDNNDVSGIRPESITVELYRKDGTTLTKVADLELNESNEWKGKFEALPKYIDGKQVIYAVKEVGAPGEYHVTMAGSQKTGFIITNTLEVVDIKVIKVWDDKNDIYGERPDYIEVVLKANGVQVGTSQKISKDDSWEYTFKNLPKYNEGKEIEYTIEELSVPGYSLPEINKTINPATTTEPVTIVYTIVNPHPKVDVPGYIEISGRVWLDVPDAKGNDANGKLDETETAPDEPIKVVLKDEHGTQFDATSYTTTDANGYYTIKVNYDNSKNAYKLYADETTVANRLKNAYVEFEYNAYKYTTVAVASLGDTAADTSKAVESETSRNAFDSKYATMTSKTDASVAKTETVTANTSSIIDFETYSKFDTLERDEIIKYCNGNGTYNQTDIAGGCIHVDTKTCDTVSHPDTCPGEGHSLAKWGVEVIRYQNVNMGLIIRETPDIAIKTNLTKVEVEMNSQQYTYLYNSMGGSTPAAGDLKAKFQYKDCYTYRKPINPSDIAYINSVDKNAMKVQVTYQLKFLNSSTTLPVVIHNFRNYYDSRYTLTTSGYKQLLYGDVNCDGKVNKEDVEYLNKYLAGITGYGLSELGEMNADAYNDGKLNVRDSRAIQQYLAKVDGYEILPYMPEKTEQTGDKFNTAIYDGDLNILLQPGSESSVIELTYTVSSDALKDLLNDKATLNNIVEIESYSTTYGEKTIYAEQRIHESEAAKGKTGRAGRPYAGYDNDSILGNAGVFYDTNMEILRSEQARQSYIAANEKEIAGIEELIYEIDHKYKNLEDDTYFAQSFVLEMDSNYKILSGNVWEDSDANSSDSYRLGDGIKASGDNNVANVKVELHEVNADGSIGGIAKLYSINKDASIPRIEEKEAVAYTNSEGNYSFGDGTTFGPATEKYIIRFIYGESSTIKDVEFSARDYKSTIINSASTVYGLFKGTATGDEWHLNLPKGYSIAVDDIATRVAISDLQYGNFNDKVGMIADSKPFEMQVEFNPDPTKTSIVGVDGYTTYGHELDAFDFGIIERAREDVFVTTTMDNFKLILANGQVITNGNPQTDEMNYAKLIGFNQVINNGADARKAYDKQMIVELDAELIQGAQLDASYQITVTNNSEKEIDYYIGNEDDPYNPSNVRAEFYYFGTNSERSPEIAESVNQVVTYLDSELVYTWDDASKWTEVSAQDLETNKLISKPTHDAIINAASDNEEYIIYTTNTAADLKPGETIKYNLKASRLLANTDQNEYDIQAEILEIDAKTARTTKQSGFAKEYKMGNYVPSLVTRKANNDINLEQAGLHEQDDDRLKIVITTPTGDTTYITTYMIVALLALTVIAIVVIFAKKRSVRR